MLYYVIVTLREYKQPREILLKSLADCGIHSSQIILVYGNEKEEYMNTYTKDIHLKHNIYEYNAFIGVKKLIDNNIVQESDSFLLLHDTSKAGSLFKDRAQILYNHHLENHADFSWAHNKGQCNICIFSSNACNEVYKRFKDTLTMEKKVAIQMEHNANEQSLKFIPVKHIYSNDSAAVIGKQKVYSDVERMVLYMPCLDLYKYYFDCGMNMDGPHPERP